MKAPTGPSTNFIHRCRGRRRKGRWRTRKRGRAKDEHPQRKNITIIIESAEHGGEDTCRVSDTRADSTTQMRWRGELAIRLRHVFFERKKVKLTIFDTAQLTSATRKPAAQYQRPSPHPTSVPSRSRAKPENPFALCARSRPSMTPFLAHQSPSPHLHPPTIPPPILPTSPK